MAEWEIISVDPIEKPADPWEIVDVTPILAPGPLARATTEVTGLAGTQVEPETFLGRVAEAWETGELQTELGILGYRKIIGEDLPEIEGRITEIKSLLPTQPPKKRGIPERAVKFVAGQIPLMASGMKKGAQRGLTLGLGAAAITAVAGQIGPQAVLPEEIITVPSAFTAMYGVGMLSGTIENISQIEAGLAYIELRDLKDAKGNKIDPVITKSAAAGVGIINGLIEMAQIKLLLKTIPGGDALLRAAIRKATIKTVRSKTLHSIALRAAKRHAAFVTAETSQEVAQESTNILANETAKFFSNEIQKKTDIPYTTRKEITSRLLAVAEESVIGFTLMGVPGQTATITGEVVRPEAPIPVKAELVEKGVPEEEITEPTIVRQQKVAQKESQKQAFLTKIAEDVVDPDNPLTAAEVALMGQYVPEELEISQQELNRAAAKGIQTTVISGITEEVAKAGEKILVPEPETVEIEVPEPEIVEEEIPVEEVEIVEPEVKPVPTAKEIDTAAKKTEPKPTEAQIEADNYKKGHVKLYGFDISIETAKGSVRSGVDRQGKKWSITMQHHYGDILGTKGKDKDHLDVFIGPKPETDKVFVVDQTAPETGKFDEHKIMMGFETEEEARAGYLANYEEGWKGLGTITEFTVDEFKTWTRLADTTEAIGEIKPAEKPKEVAKPTQAKLEAKLAASQKAEEAKVKAEKGIPAETEILPEERKGVPDFMALGKKRGLRPGVSQAATEWGVIADKGQIEAAKKQLVEVQAKAKALRANAKKARAAGDIKKADRLFAEHAELAGTQSQGLREAIEASEGIWPDQASITIREKAEVKPKEVKPAKVEEVAEVTVYDKMDKAHEQDLPFSEIFDKYKSEIREEYRNRGYNLYYSKSRKSWELTLLETRHEAVGQTGIPGLTHLGKAKEGFVDIENAIKEYEEFWQKEQVKGKEVAEVAKKPHEMTQAEFIKETVPENIEEAKRQHRIKVSAAVVKGLPVSKEILGEYRGVKWADDALKGKPFRKPPKAVTVAKPKAFKKRITRYLTNWIVETGGVRDETLPGELRDLITDVDAKGRLKRARGVPPGFLNKKGRGLDEIVDEARSAGFAVEDVDDLLAKLEKDMKASMEGDVARRITVLTDEAGLDKMYEQYLEDAREHDINEREARRSVEREVTAKIKKEDEFNELADEIFEEEYNKVSEEVKPTQETLIEKEAPFELKGEEPPPKLRGPEEPKITRHFQKYTSEQRAQRAASHRLTGKQREAVGEYYYTNEFQDIAYDTRGEARRAALPFLKKKAVFPTEKIKAPAKAEQVSLIKRKGEQVTIGEKIEEKDKFDSGVDKVKDSAVQYVYAPVTKKQQLSLFDFKPSGVVRTKEAPKTGKIPSSQRIRVQTTGNIKGAGTVLAGIDDAASLIAPIRKKAQEDFYSIAVDKDGTILEIHRYSKGTKGAALVSAVEVSGRALNIPNVHMVYFAHNHPTGDAWASREDITLTGHLEDLLKAGDVRSYHIIIGRTKYSVVSKQYVGKEVNAFDIRPMLRKVSIPVKERYLVTTAELQKREQLTVWGKAVKAIEKYGNNADGVLFLTYNNKPITFLPFIKGRSMKQTTLDIVKAAESVNAHAIIINNNDISTQRRLYLEALARGPLGGELVVLDVIEKGKSWVQQRRKKAMGKGVTEYPILLSETRLQLEPSLKVRPEGYKFTKRQQKHIIKIGTLIPGWLKRAGADEEILKNITLELKPFIDLRGKDVDKTLKDWAKEGVDASTILGATTFEKYHALIQLAINGQNLAKLERTTYHEYYHVAKGWMLPRSDIDALAKYFKTEESEADAFAKYMQDAKTIDTAPGLIKRLFLKLKRMVNIIRNGLKGKGFNRPEDVFGSIRVGAYRPVRMKTRKEVKTFLARAPGFFKAVAVRLEDGTVYEGSPGEIHADVLEQLPQGIVPRDRYGFVDYQGNFYTREEATRAIGNIEMTSKQLVPETRLAVEKKPPTISKEEKAAEKYVQQALGKVKETKVVELKPTEKITGAAYDKIAVEEAQNSIDELIAKAKDDERLIHHVRSTLKKAMSIGKKAGIAKQKAHYQEVVARAKARKEKLAQIRKMIDELKTIDVEKLSPQEKQPVGDLLAGMNLVKPTKRIMARLTNTRRYLEDNPDAELPEYVMENLKRLDKRNIRDMSIEDIGSLHKAIMHYVHLNKLKGIIKVRRESKRKAEVLSSSIGEMKSPKKVKSEIVSSQKSKLGRTKKTAKLITDTFGIRHDHYDLIIESLAGMNSTMDKVLYQDVKDGITDQLKYKQESYADFLKDLGDFSAKYGISDISNWLNEQVTTGKFQFTRGERMALLRHALNRDNLRHLLAGGFGFRTSETPNKRYMISAKELNQVLQSLTPAEKHFAGTAVNKLFERQYKALNKVFYAKNNYDLPKTRDPYYPIEVMSITLGKDLETVEALEQFKGRWTRIGLEKGMLEKRIKSKKPIYLNSIAFDINRSVMKSAAYIGLEIPLSNASKMLYDRTFRAELENRYGKQTWREIEKGLRDIAGDYQSYTTVEEMALKLKNNLSVAMLGVNPFVMTKQVLSLPIYLPYVKAEYLLQGMIDFTVQPIATGERHKMYSPEYLERVEGGYSRDVADVFKGAAMKRLYAGKTTIKEKFMGGIQLFDRVAVSAGMQGAVLQVLDEFDQGKLSREVKIALDMKDADIAKLTAAERMAKAYKFADYATERTQPMFSPEHRSSLSRGATIEKLATMFGAFTNQALNLMRRTYREARRTGEPAAYTKLGKVLFLILVVNTLGVMAIDEIRDRITKKKKKPSIAARILNTWTGYMFFVRDLANSVISKVERGTFAGYNIELPIQRVPELLSNVLANSVKAFSDETPAKRKKAAMKFVDDGLNLLLMSAGIPYSTPKRIIAGTIKPKEERKY